MAAMFVATIAHIIRALRGALLLIIGGLSLVACPAPNPADAGGGGERRDAGLDAGTVDVVRPDAADAGLGDDGGYRDAADILPDEDAGMSHDAGSVLDGGADAGPPMMRVEVDAFGRVVIYPGPLLVDNCSTCPDVDGDGLSDDAETFILNAVVPAVALTPDDPAHLEGDFAVRAVGRVARAAGGERVRIFMMLGYIRDYGSCGLTAHAGDSERMAFELDIETGEDGAPMLTMRRAYTAAHEGELSDRSRLLTSAELPSLLQQATDENGWTHPLVFSSHNKHATYVSASACADAFVIPCFVETCAPNADEATLVRPDIINAGEPDAPLVTDLSAVGFPGEDAWADIPFCGGLRDDNGDIGEGCSSPVFEKLTNDPFL